MKIYLDDMREAPLGWIRCYWPHEVIALLKEGNVEAISLDHDLGDDSIGTGMDVCKWIEQTVFEHGFDGGFIPPAIMVHSANPVGRRNMEISINWVNHNFKVFSATHPEEWETFLNRLNSVSS